MTDLERPKFTPLPAVFRSKRNEPVRPAMNGVNGFPLWAILRSKGG